MKGKSKEIQSTPEGAYRFGEFEVYPSERQLHRQNIEEPLPPKAFDALMILVRKAGQLVRKEELIEALWPETFVTEAWSLISPRREAADDAFDHREDELNVDDRRFGLS